MSDLVERLRLALDSSDPWQVYDLGDEAADALEQMEADNEKCDERAGAIVSELVDARATIARLEKDLHSATVANGILIDRDTAYQATIARLEAEIERLNRFSIEHMGPP